MATSFLASLSWPGTWPPRHLQVSSGHSISPGLPMLWADPDLWVNLYENQILHLFHLPYGALNMCRKEAPVNWFKTHQGKSQVLCSQSGIWEEKQKVRAANQPIPSGGSWKSDLISLLHLHICLCWTSSTLSCLVDMPSLPYESKFLEDSTG